MLRWKKNPRPTGLAGVVAGPQGSTLRDGEVRYATTGYSRSFDRKEPSGWYWVAGWGSGVPHHNSCDSLLPNEASAKAGAAAYVKNHMKSSPAGAADNSKESKQ